LAVVEFFTFTMLSFMVTWSPSLQLSVDIGSHRVSTAAGPLVTSDPYGCGSLQCLLTIFGDYT